MKSWRGVVTAVGLGLVGAAIAQELSRPAEQRTWHGRLAGVIPYDFRPPTLDRLRQAYWSPENPNLFTDHPFGVGWALNLARLRPAA